MLSIALALILFAFYRMSIMTIRAFSVPLAVETSSTLVPASSYPQDVRIQLRGEDDDVKSILEADIEAYVDFSRYETEGLYRAPVHTRRKGSALGVEPLEISVTPLEISVRLDLRIDKTLPLVADIRGDVASGFDLMSHLIFPMEVVVSGPAGVLENISEIKTNIIDLDGRRGDFIVEVNIASPSPFLALRGSGRAEFRGFIRPKQ